jgi:hypothetical protein
MMLCRLCRGPLRDDRFTVNPGRPLVAHRRCAFQFMRDVAFAEWIASDDAHPDAARWHAVWYAMIALDPPMHVEWLLSSLVRADQVDQS